MHRYSTMQYYHRKISIYPQAVLINRSVKIVDRYLYQY